MISTPYMEGDYIYGVDSYGELRCLDARTGNRVWEDLTAVPKARWATIHMVRNGDRTWMFNERGELIIATLSPQGFHEMSRASRLCRRPTNWGRGAASAGRIPPTPTSTFLHATIEICLASLAAEKPGTSKSKAP